MAELEIYRAKEPVKYEARVDLNYGDNAVDVLCLQQHKLLDCPYEYDGYAIREVHEDNYVIWITYIDGVNGAPLFKHGTAETNEEVREAADKLVREAAEKSRGN